MMSLRADASSRTVSFRASRSVYSKQSLAIAAHVFEPKAEVSSAESGKSFDVALKSKRKQITEAELAALGGEFFNELLNQEYRLLVGNLNAGISNLIVTQTLYCAGGGEKAAKSRAGETSREFKAAVDRLMRDARAEIKATMPKKISPRRAL
jgi:hypothetical protein